MSWLSRLIDSFRREPRPDPTDALQPRVRPDPDAAAALARRYGELDYCPENGFIRDQRQERRS